MTQHSNPSSEQPLNEQPKYLWFLTLTYTIVILLANWFDLRLIHILGLDTDAGTLIFPLTFLLSDLITEVYGYKYARRAIWCGFLFNLIFIFYGQLVIHMPSPNYPTQNALFDTLLAFNGRIIIASIISYIISEPINSLIVAKLKIKMNGHYMGIRFVLSTFFASLIDSIVFGTLAFYGILTGNQLLSLIFSMWALKVGIEILGLPFSIRLAKRLKEIESLDIYDQGTDYRMWVLDTNYAAKNNQFRK